MGEGEHAVIKAFYAALVRNDLAAVGSLLSPDVRHVVYSDGGPTPFEGTFHGRSAVVSQLGETAKAWDVVGLDVLQLEVDGSRAAARVRTRARHRVEARTLQIDGTHFFELGENGIEGFDIFFQCADPPPPAFAAANEP